MNEEQNAVINGLISNHQEILKLKKECDLLLTKNSKIDVIRENVLEKLKQLQEKDKQLEDDLKLAFKAIQVQTDEIKVHMADEEIHHLNVNNSIKETNRILKTLANRTEMKDEIKKLESRINQESNRVTMGFKMAGYVFAGVLFVLNMVWWFISSDMRIVSSRDFPQVPAIHKTYKVEGDLNKNYNIPNK